MQPWILLTNYHRYVDQFIRHGWSSCATNPRFVRMVLPGNVIIERGTSEDAQAVPTQWSGTAYQMPAYHLIASDGHGITLVNIGVGPSNAKNITDHLAVLRPHCWLMIGHCGGLRQSQTIGDYVLAHAYMRRDGILDRVLPPHIPIPALAEVQQALQEAAASVTGERGETLKKRLRTGTVLTYDDRNWELHWAHERPLINLSRAVAVDMESGTIAAQGYRLRVPYGTLLCVSDKPLHSEIKLPGSATGFYQRAVSQHLAIGIAALDLLRCQLDSLYCASCAASTSRRSADALWRTSSGSGARRRPVCARLCARWSRQGRLHSWTRPGACCGAVGAFSFLPLFGPLASWLGLVGGLLLGAAASAAVGKGGEALHHWLPAVLPAVASGGVSAPHRMAASSRSTGIWTVTRRWCRTSPMICGAISRLTRKRRISRRWCRSCRPAACRACSIIWLRSTCRRKCWRGAPLLEQASLTERMASGLLDLLQAAMLEELVRDTVAQQADKYIGEWIARWCWLRWMRGSSSCSRPTSCRSAQAADRPGVQTSIPVAAVRRAAAGPDRDVAVAPAAAGHQRYSRLSQPQMQGKGRSAPSSAERPICSPWAR